MPVTLGFDPAARRATLTYTGTVTGDDLTNAVDRLYTDARWTPGLCVLWDGSGITSLLVEPDDPGALIDAHRRHADAAAGTCNALVAVRGDDRLIAELFMTHARTLAPTYRLFDTRDDALAWLDEQA